MKGWEQTLVSPDTPLRKALEVIDRVGCRMALVVDADRRLLGTLSDGDARRALLRGLTLADPASAAMHVNPAWIKAGESRQSILATMRRLSLYQMPLLDDQGRVQGLEIVDDYRAAPTRQNCVVVMAGGLGSRMQDLTRHVPKPMLRVGSRPLIETIVRSFADQGFRRFYLAVNYMADQIEAHFGNGAALDVDVCYLREDRRLGTAGALSLLPEQPSVPIFVTNGDLLTREDFGRMVDLHEQSGADATMAVRDYEMQVPFGVVRERDGHIEAVEEKPIQRFVVSAGMYVLSPAAVRQVPHGQYFDMPMLFQMLMSQGMRTRCHPIDGYWLDIGRIGDYERANNDFNQVFQ